MTVNKTKEKVKNAIQSIVEETKDKCIIGYENILVLGVNELNPIVPSKYKRKNGHLRYKADDDILLGVRSFRGVFSKVKTAKKLNEFYLFYDCESQEALDIARDGFPVGTLSFYENPISCHKKRADVDDCIRVMVAARVTLGICKNQSSGHVHFHSTFEEDGDIGRKFTVYQSSACLPRFIISYKPSLHPDDFQYVPMSPYPPQLIPQQQKKRKTENENVLAVGVSAQKTENKHKKKKKPSISARISKTTETLYREGKNKVGKGKEARNSMHRRICVTKVKQVKCSINAALNKSYKNETAIKWNDLKIKIPALSSVRSDERQLKSDGRVETKFLSTKRGIRDLKRKVNEVLLYHGCTREAAENIAEEGFKLGRSDAMFGEGVYFAENPVKADQYADAKDNRSDDGTELTMILARVTLGYPYLCGRLEVREKIDDNSVWPPLYHGLFERRKKKKKYHKVRYDSVMCQEDFRFREFVVYDTSACVPAFIITYKRVSENE